MRIVGRGGVEDALVTQGAEHLVVGDVHHVASFADRLGVRRPVPPGGVEQRGGAEDVGAHEGQRDVDAAVLVRLGRQVEDRRGCLLGEESPDVRRLLDVVLDAVRPWFVGRVAALTGVRERVEREHAAREPREQLTHHAAADEADAAGSERRCVVQLVNHAFRPAAAQGGRWSWCASGRPDRA